MSWLAILAGCGGGTWNEVRTAWLVDALVEDNRVWLSRDHELLAGKYRVMAADPYDFMRGTASVFYRDLELSGSSRSETAFVSSIEAASVLLVGDPHPENVGTMRPGPDPGEPVDQGAVLLFEHNDFDAAGFGPYLLDVRRAQLGLSLLLSSAGCSVSCRERVQRAWLGAWLDGIGGADTSSAAIVGRSPLLDELIEQVLSEGPAGALLDEVTVSDLDGTRHFALDSALDASGIGTLAVTEEEREQAVRLLASDEQLQVLRIHDIARRYGVGVASRPAFRYVVVYDHGDNGPQDDAMIQLREVVDPPALYTVPSHPGVLFDSSAHRSVAAPALLWSDPEADARMMAVSDGGMTFKVQTWSSWFQSIDHLDIEKSTSGGPEDEAALTSMAQTLGLLLAGAHTRSVTSSLAPAGPAIAADINGRAAAFIDERIRDAESDLARTLADHARFVSALERYGPLLGASGLGP